MESIDISELLNYFKSKIVYIIFIASVFFCISGIYVNRFRTPVYTSSTTILLNQANENIAINTNDLTLNKTLVPTYREIIKSKRVLSQVIKSLDLEYEYNELANMVGVSEITDTSIINVAVTNKDRALAASVANTIAEVFTKEIVDIYNIENISIIDEAEESVKPSSTSAVKVVLIVTLIGILLSVAVFFVIFYFDTSLKSEEDIERITGLPVIGVVPLSGKEQKGHINTVKPIRKVEPLNKQSSVHNKEEKITNTFDQEVKN